MDVDPQVLGLFEQVQTVLNKMADAIQEIGDYADVDIRWEMSGIRYEIQQLEDQITTQRNVR